MDDFDFLGGSTTNAPAANQTTTEVKTEPATGNDYPADDFFADFAAPVQNQPQKPVDILGDDINIQNEPYDGDLTADPIQTTPSNDQDQQLFNTDLPDDTKGQDSTLFDDQQHVPVDEWTQQQPEEEKDQQQPPIDNWSTQEEQQPAPSPSPAMHSSSSETLTPPQKLQRDFEERVAAKDAEENRRKEELRQQAKSDLDHWYNERKRQMEQKRETMKTDEETLRLKALEKSQKETCDWAKVIRFLEFSSGTQVSKNKRDLTRMKTTIINAKRQLDNKNSATTTSNNGV